MYIANYSVSNVAKIVVSHKKNFPFGFSGVDDYWETYPLALMDTFFRKWKYPIHLLTWLWSGWIDYIVIQHGSRSVTMSFLCFTTNGVLVLAFLFLILCGVSIHMFIHICVQAINIKGTTVGERFQILIFCVVIARSFPFLPLLRHYVLTINSLFPTDYETWEQARLN